MIAKQLQIIVNSNPNKISIDDCNGGEISYRQLWELVCTFSAAIDDFAQDDKYIGLIADQDAYAVIALVSTILNGRTIIPIDPRLSALEIEEILSPFTCKIICRNIDTRIFSKRFVALECEDLISRESTNYCFKDEDTDAYIIHTSGTTGKPKPVLAKQGALLHVVTELISRYYIDNNSNVLQFAYMSFDSSLAEIFSTFLSGGTLIIPGCQLRNDAYSVLETLLMRKAISVATLPPSFALGCKTTALSNLDTLILAGEECPINLANSLYKKVKHLINAYGPTESIICATTYEIKSLQNICRVPIGTPLNGMRIEIANIKENCSDTPGSGEMLLFSDYLAQGYPGHKRETSEKFKVNPKTNAIYYTTGDIGHINDDGNYEFLGRIDNQIKINGQRIELESIESNIKRITGITELIVIYDGHLYCAYKNNGAAQSFDIRGSLSGKMSLHTIPNVFILVDSILLDGNGKINRRDMLNKIKEQLRSTKTINKTDNNFCNEMIILWEATISASNSMINDNSDFFEVGGDSLSALRLVKAINDKYLINIKLAEILQGTVTPLKMSSIVENKLILTRTLNDN